MDPHCLQAKRFEVLYHLCREGAYDEASQKMADLKMELDRTEPKNAYLYDEFAKVVCRVVSILLYKLMVMLDIYCSSGTLLCLPLWSSQICALVDVLYTRV